MKVAVITFSDFNTNYGSMLQSYALHLYLNKLGHEVTFIKYREFDKQTSVNLTFSNIKQIIKTNILNVYSFLKRNDMKKTNINFEEFKKRLNYTKLYTSNEDLKQIDGCYDCYICGSDQIWNFDCLGGLRKPYFLDFVSDKNLKIAYAASAGNYRFNNEEMKIVEELLHDFSYISVRENETAELMNKCLDKKISTVVDPTFLIDKQEWESLLPALDVEGEYAVCYFVRRSKKAKAIIRELNKTYKIPIYNLSDNNIYINGTISKYISAGPLEFLSLIKGAKFTVGTSFHLAVFSIIFEKPFLIIGLEHNRSRINNILHLVDLPSNYISEQDECSNFVRSLFEQKINKGKLLEKIEYSKRYLQQAVNDSEKGCLNEKEF